MDLYRERYPSAAAAATRSPERQALIAGHTWDPNANPWATQAPRYPCRLDYAFAHGLNPSSDWLRCERQLEKAGAQRSDHFAVGGRLYFG
jgi:hypothetical protein